MTQNAEGQRKYIPKTLKKKDVQNAKPVVKYRAWSQNELTVLKWVMEATPPLLPPVLRSLFKRSLCSIRTKAYQIYGHFPKYAVCGRKPKIKHDLKHVKSLYCEQGCSVKELAKLYDVKPCTVRGTLHMAGAKFAHTNDENKSKHNDRIAHILRDLRRWKAGMTMGDYRSYV
jgi:hypothetical protein